MRGLRVIELGDEQIEYCGLLLAGLGADVVKVEPPGGSPTRRIGPFHGDVADPERSLFFWHYNRAKRSVVLDLDTPDGAADFRALLRSADLVLDATPSVAQQARAMTPQDLLDANPALIVGRLSAFGDDGPWSHFKGSDLVHLALGGQALNCGYDPEPGGQYDLPPIAPQMWQSWHVAGEELLIGLLGALLHRERTGQGQIVAMAVHEALAKNTEIDLMNWVMRRAPVYRQTCRHALESVSDVRNIAPTKDGRWVMTMGSVRGDTNAALVSLLERLGMTVPADLASTHQEPPGDPGARRHRMIPGLGDDEPLNRTTEIMHRIVAKYGYASVPWREAQEEGLLWAPLRLPHENAQDPHWLARGTFASIDHPELSRSFVYPVGKWVSSEAPWVAGRRAPLLGEDTAQVLRSAGEAGARDARPRERRGSSRHDEALSPHGRPFALADVRVLDFSWFLATGGAGRFLAAMGAECIKVEWIGNPDTRLGAMAPIGGREARECATTVLQGVDDPAMGGQFNNKHPGKLGISLNVRTARGLEIARELVRRSDVVAEGFAPGVMERLGLGYKDLASVREDIILARQSGTGVHGTYGALRVVGPVAQALAGSSEMSGLPEPFPPAGWGYSYLDWMGAYSFAAAILSALWYRNLTGRGQEIDASQTEVGIWATGTATLDWSANGRTWTRTGNTSPYKPAAPHGIYPCTGQDRWIALACFTNDEWQALVDLGGSQFDLPEFADLPSRLVHREALDRAVATWTATHERYALMEALQARGVPAGVCQTAEDRCDHDPQLAFLGWLTEVTGTKIGTWPVAEVPYRMSRTPAHIGGPRDRGAPVYGEDNEYVYGELLGLTSREIGELAAQGVI